MCSSKSVLDPDLCSRLKPQIYSYEANENITITYVEICLSFPLWMLQQMHAIIHAVIQGEDLKTSISPLENTYLSLIGSGWCEQECMKVG
jgi:hypothetical protein